VFDFKKLLGQAIAALISAFGGVAAAVQSVAGSFQLDVSASKTVVVAAISAAISSLLVAGWGILKQLWEGAKGYFPADPEALAHLKDAEASIAAAEKQLRG